VSRCGQRPWPNARRAVDGRPPWVIIRYSSTTLGGTHVTTQPYTAPTLTSYGSLAALTAGGQFSGVDQGSMQQAQP
jgi:hypothetical protein